MSLPRLSSSTLDAAAGAVRRPAFDRTRLGVGIVHLGLGAFARAHLAEYTDDALALEPGDWGITGVSLRRPDQRDLLAPQDGLYTLVGRDGAHAGARIIGCLAHVLVAPENPQAVLAAMAAPATRIVSLTVTEKGYCHDPATGRLNLDHPDIRHDLDHPDSPVSAIGYIVAALARRRAAGLAPFTVLCCDNLPGNGALVAGLVQTLAGRRADGLARWIADNGAFPATMVDRIVPAATAKDTADAAGLTGLHDAAALSHEPFRQWVIEDRFVGGDRPAWHRVGAELVTEVAPYEHMKLRLLNGTHSALAYLGYLAGHETIGDCVTDPVFETCVRKLWREEIIPVVAPPPGADLARYADALLARYRNPAIRHRTWQIAMDGSQKLPQRILSTLRDRIARGLASPGLTLVVAAWIRYVGGLDEKGAAIDVRDPLAAVLRETLDRAGPDPAARVRAILCIEAVFGTDLARNAAFVGALTQACRVLDAQGARAAVAAL